MSTEQIDGTREGQEKRVFVLFRDYDQYIKGSSSYSFVTSPILEGAGCGAGEIWRDLIEIARRAKGEGYEIKFAETPIFLELSRVEDRWYARYPLHSYDETLVREKLGL